MNEPSFPHAREATKLALAAKARGVFARATPEPKVDVAAFVEAHTNPKLSRGISPLAARSKR